MTSSIGGSKNLVHSLRGREYGAKNDLEKNFEETRLTKNIKSKISRQITFKDHSQNIRGFDVHDSFVAVAENSNKIKLWNKETQKCLWTSQVESNQKIIWSENIKIVDDKIVCAGTLRIATLVEFSIVHRYKHRIYLLDRKTGVQTALIEDWRIQFNHISIIGRKIFAYLSDNRVATWNFEGKLLSCFALERLPTPISAFLAIDTHLILIFQRTVVIVDLASGTQKMLAVSNVPITSHYMDGSHLICGFNTFRDEAWGDYSCFDACVIDLVSGHITHQYTAKDAFLHSEIDLYSGQEYVTENGVISSIARNQKWLALGHSSGKLVVVNLEQKEPVILGKHNHSIRRLLLKGNLLISETCKKKDQESPNQGKLKFWDLKLMEEIGKIGMTSLRQTSFVEGKLYISSGKSLVCIDYLV